ncbi:MAG: UPF0280 family protein [Clostridia bacterium]
MRANNLNKYHISLDESDLIIFTKKIDVQKVRKYLQKCRQEIIDAIKLNNDFLTSFEPIRMDNKFSKIAKDMISATNHYEVGPMAAVAGAVALYLGRYIKKANQEVIIENGGDLYIYTTSKRFINLYTEDNIYKDRLNIEINPTGTELSICTSSRKLGHSQSLGNSDAVVIKADNAIYADAGATAYANKVKTKIDIERVLLEAKEDKYIKGIIIIIDGYLGAWGDIKLRERDY